MGLAETVFLVGGFAVMGWYVINYVLPNLPQAGGQFTEGDTGGGDNAGSVNTNCIPQSNGTSCWKSASCKTSPNPAGRGNTVSWCVKGGCSQARDAWLAQFKCTGNVTPKVSAPPKVLNNPSSCSGSNANCSWDCKNAYCWTGPACGKTGKSCTSPGQSTNRTTGCSVARNRFLAAYGSCGSSSTPYAQATSGPCAGLTGQTACTCAAQHGACRSTYHGVYSNGKCNCVPNTTTTTVPQPTAPSGCPGKSGNCNWDCKNAYCWTSTGPKANKICISNGINRTTGCNQARNAFIAYNK